MHKSVFATLLAAALGAPAPAAALFTYDLLNIELECSVCFDEAGTRFDAGDGAFVDIFGTITTRRLGVLSDPADIVGFTIRALPRDPNIVPITFSGTQVGLIDDSDPFNGAPARFEATPTELRYLGTGLSEAVFADAAPPFTSAFVVAEGELSTFYEAGVQTLVSAVETGRGQAIAFRQTEIPAPFAAPLLATGLIALATLRRRRRRAAQA